MWARKYDKCIKCGTTSKKHISRGLCILCYYKDIEQRHLKHKRQRNFASTLINKSYLINEYVHTKKSLSEIAEKCGCSRQYIFKKMLAYGIPLRNKQSARKIALNAGKIVVQRQDENGTSKNVVYNKIEYDTNFFKSWSPEMAYVLGLIYTDGCLSIRKSTSHINTKYTPHLSFAQKEQELPQKVLVLLKCNSKLFLRKAKKYGEIMCGQVYWFDLDCTMIYHDLVRLGLKPSKSLSISFPEIPTEYLRHFVRGCWDGDGSVYYEKASNRIRASYVSGSLHFINGLVTALEEAGIPRRNIYQKETNPPSYYVRLAESHSAVLYHYLYDNVPPELRLERKYQKFSRYFGPLALKKPIQKTLF